MRIKIPSKQDIRNSSFGHWISNFCYRNWVVKTIVLFLIWLVISIPFDIYLLVRWGIGPQTFWEEIALILVTILAIGWLQGILLFLGIVTSLFVLLEDL